MKFKLEIKMGNEAMYSEENISHALRRVAEKILKVPEGSIRDDNGNFVGKFCLK